ncbi:MAG: hypothetical protein ACE37K_15000 [Planctomycetota bacterium]
MPTLKERLDRLKQASAERTPPEAKAIMNRATQDLRDSGILDRLPRPGAALPPFELPDTNGHAVRAVDLHGDGPLVVTFYRGVW